MSGSGERSPRTIYHDAIVAAARRAHGAGHLEHPDATVTVDNPLCGDRITVDVKVRDGGLSAYAHRVRGCLLCEATASVIADNALGAGAGSLAAVHQGVVELLAGERSREALAWRDLEMFAPVRDYRARHECVLLAFQALDRAMVEAGGGPVVARGA